MHKLIIPTSILAMTVGIAPSYGQSGAAASFASTAAECSAAARLARLKPIKVRQSQREVPNGLPIITQGVTQMNRMFSRSLVTAAVTSVALFASVAGLG